MTGWEEIDTKDADYLIVAFGSIARIATKAKELAAENAIAKRGTSVVEVVATCNSGWKMTPEKANEWMAEHMFKVYPLGDLKDTTKEQ